MIGQTTSWYIRLVVLTFHLLCIPQQGTYRSMIGMGGRHLFAVDVATNAEYLKELLYEKKDNVR